MVLKLHTGPSERAEVTPLGNLFDSLGLSPYMPGIYMLGHPVVAVLM